MIVVPFEGKHMFNEGLTPEPAGCRRKATGAKKEPLEGGSREFNREASNRVAPAAR